MCITVAAKKKKKKVEVLIVFNASILETILVYFGDVSAKDKIKEADL